MAPDRLEDRQNLLKTLDRVRYAADSGGSLEGLTGIQQRAFDALMRGVASAFDLSKEDPKTLARYDTASYFQTLLWGKKNNSKWYTAHIQTVGKLMLLAVSVRLAAV